MAGAGYKLFQTGDVLTAAQVNTYLNEQTVMVFASAAARTSALTSVLAEGMVSYLQDTNAVEVYNGSAWVSIGSSGDITGVTAGTGISGGGTSGTVTITNDMATTITAAGDIVVGTGSGTYDNLPIGTTGQVLTADTTVSPYKVKWASAASGGGMTLISTTSLSGSSISLTSIPSTYKDLRIVVRGFKPSTDGNLYLRVNQDSNANRHFHSVSNDIYTGDSFNATSINCSNTQDSGGDNSLITIDIFDYTNTTTWKLLNSSAITNNGTTVTNLNYRFGMGAYNQTSAISSLDILPSSGTFSAGSLLLYGVS